MGNRTNVGARRWWAGNINLGNRFLFELDWGQTPSVVGSRDRTDIRMGKCA